MTVKKLGRPPLGGVRIHVRFDEEMLERLGKKVRILNKKAKFGGKTDRNAFIVQAVAEAMKKVK